MHKRLAHTPRPLPKEGAEDAEGSVSRRCGRVAVLLFPRVLGALPGLRRREGHEINAPKCMLRSGEKNMAKCLRFFGVMSFETGRKHTGETMVEIWRRSIRAAKRKLYMR